METLRTFPGSYVRTHHTLSVMIALWLACTIATSGIHAQSNTEYSFRQQSVIDGQAYNSNNDPVDLPQNRREHIGLC